MRLAVLSDIHSNSIAFQACVDYISRHSIDGIIFLGDYVSDCPKPQETLELMKMLKGQYKTWYVKGNREEYFLNYEDGKLKEWNYSSYNGSLLYTYERLTKKDLEVFRNYPNSLVIQIEGMESLTIAHGSPASSRELLHADQEPTDRCLENLDTKYLLCGHTHKQCIYEHKGKILINPGAVGVAIDAISSAHFAILEWRNNHWDCEMVSVPYDLELLKKKFLQSTLLEKANVWPKCILKSIESGVNMGPICAKRAYDLALSHGEVITDRIVPEQYWEQAAKELGITE